MSLRGSSYVAPRSRSPKGARKRKTAFFGVRSHFAWRKSATVLCVKTVRVQNDWWRMSPSAWKFGAYWPTRFQNADLRSIFARSASAETPSETCSINTNRKSITRFPNSPIWTSYVVPKPLPKGWLKNSVSKIWAISCDNSGTVRDRICLTINH